MSFMKQALRIAEEGRMTCMPNPMVGCVIVKNGHVVGMGAHLKAGMPHAEINALVQAGNNVVGADVYLTLEPCSHFGRTPPCVDALISASVKSVHVALQDPNPLVAGKGIARLKDAGIHVVVGECQEEAYQLNKSFFHYITQKKPFVIAKWAMSLDGKIASGVASEWGPKKWITSEQARIHAHMMRASVGGIMVGENTVRIDNPSLTVRHEVYNIKNIQPRPIVLTIAGDIPLDSKILDCDRNALIITSYKASSKFLSFLDKNHLEYSIVSLEDNLLVLSEVAELLASKGMSRLLVEGGSQLLTQFFRHGLVNQVCAYIAPKIIGGVNSLSPIMGSIIADVDSDSFFNWQEYIPLGPDICFLGETLLTPKTYDDFIKRSNHV